MSNFDNNQPGQWRQLAGPGHVLLARVDAWRHLASRYVWLIALFGVIVGLFASFAPVVARALVEPVGRLSNSVSTSIAGISGAPAVTPEVQMPVPTDIVPVAGDHDALTRRLDRQTLLTAIDAAAKRVEAGEKVDGCNVAEMTTSFVPATGKSPVNCKLAGDRTWIWGGTYQPASGYDEPRYMAYAFVIRKAKDGKVETYQVPVAHSMADGRVVQPVRLSNSIQPMEPARIRRALSEDLKLVAASQGASK